MTQFHSLMTMSEFVRKLNDGLTTPIGKAKIYKMIKEPGFPAVKIGGRLFVLADKVNDWFEGKATEASRGDE